MKVFITGATGYIGFEVAKTFRNAGHHVLGLTRSEEKAKLLAKNEIVPIIGSLQNSSSFKKVAKESDILIHAAADYENNFAELDQNTIETLIKLSKNSKSIKKLIYTSGVWVYGNTNGKYATEETKVNPIKVVEWRPEADKRVLDNSDVNGIVIRPGCVYGKQGNMTNEWFQAVNNGTETIDIIGDGNNHWPLVHVDDLARAYLLAAEKDIANEAFNIVEEDSHSINEIISKLTALTNFKGSVKNISKSDAIKELGNFAEALAIDQKFDTSKAKQLLSWKSYHPGFYDELKLYYSTWKAYNS